MENSSRSENHLQTHPTISSLTLGFEWFSSTSGFFALIADCAEYVLLEIYSVDIEPVLLSKWQAEPYSSNSQYYTIMVESLPTSFCYGWRVKRSQGLSPLFCDPCHPYLFGVHHWRKKTRYDLSHVFPYSSFDWQDSTSPNHSIHNLRIYEAHVRALSLENQKINLDERGSFKALLPILDHLKSLNLNAIELMPVQEFNESNAQNVHPHTRCALVDFWGYMPLHPLALMRAYSVDGTSAQAELEFCQFVKQAHLRGIEVILDVVFNHVGGPFHPLVASLPYSGFHRISEGGASHLVDYTGCGNTINANHPNSLAIILHSLRYMATQWRIDGLRFDLAAALGREPGGECHAESLFFQTVSQDPVLKNLKLIVEPWDAKGGWLLGKLSPYGFIEWSDRYRDDVRSFINFAQNKGSAATRLCGSSDLYTRQSTINFITCHDGFCLTDLVSYNQKHNEENGENNRDGHNHNLSHNHGCEGPSSHSIIKILRQKQRYNFFTALAVTLGPIMILSGDEYGHSRLGNNNPWCQDNHLNALDWATIQEQPSLTTYVQTLMNWRAQCPFYSEGKFFQENDITWHGQSPNAPYWNLEDGFLAFELKTKDKHTYIAFNSSYFAKEVSLPSAPYESWVYVVTSMYLPPALSPFFIMEPKSCLIIESKYLRP
jgi:isoamylase